MPQTTAKKAKAPATRARAATGKSASTPRSAPAEPKSAVARTAEVSEEVLKSIEAGQRAAIDAVRKFVDTVDDVLPAVGGHPSRREKVIDAALEMADRLVTAQYEFMHSVVKGALSRPDGSRS